ncbi:hypothetical protein [Haloarchaeobius sp. HRN-SO-5]|uniref:hypothetical protein n=1 Tax=Haloarchaeobius sp. HRN-SO-5 TaxID=3446118 RepID=UPI003EBB209A
MTGRPSWSAVACVLLVLLAGCGAQEIDNSPSGATNATTHAEVAADETRSQPSTGEAEVPYRGGELSFTAGPVFKRVEVLLGVDAQLPTHVQVLNETEWFGDDDGDTARRVATPAGRFGRLLGVSGRPNRSVLRSMSNGATGPLGTVAVYPANESPATLEVLLAHEFVHVVQFQRGDVSTVRGRVGEQWTTDGSWTARSVIEGVAVWTETRYVGSYDVATDTGGERTASLYRRLEPGSPARHGQSAYLYGYRYVSAQTTSLARVDAVYEDPPTTSEQVLHGLDPGSEPPVDLWVRTRDGNSWRGRQSDRLGEAYTRVVLENGVPVERAERAAAGWGSDWLLTYREDPTADASFVWVTRWDTDADADEFAAAMNRTFDAAGRRVAGRWVLDATRGPGESPARGAIVRPDDRTVVVTVGDADLLDVLSVSSDGETVVLRTTTNATDPSREPQATTLGASYVLA